MAGEGLIRDRDPALAHMTEGMVVLIVVQRAETGATARVRARAGQEVDPEVKAENCKTSRKEFDLCT